MPSSTELCTKQDRTCRAHTLKAQLAEYQRELQALQEKQATLELGQLLHERHVRERLNKQREDVGGSD